MTHPITPPQELIEQWVDEYIHTKPDCTAPQLVAARSAQWGADQELEACCEWLEHMVLLRHQHDVVPSLRAARRPKPPSLKRQALTALTRYTTGETILTNESVDIIRRALEQLDD